MPITKRLSAEFIGTLWLVLGGCGTAVLAGFQAAGNVGISLAFGLTVLTMAYAIGHISGCHLNPAVTLGLWAGKRFPANDVLPYIIAQVFGAISGGRHFVYHRQRQIGFCPQRRFCIERLWRPFAGSLRSHGLLCRRSRPDVLFPDRHSRLDAQARAKRLCPDRYRSLPDADPSDLDPGNKHVGQPRPQHGPSRFCSRLGVAQLWMFWVAPILGALLAGFVYGWLAGDDDAPAAKPADTPKGDDDILEV